VVSDIRTRDTGGHLGAVYATGKACGIDPGRKAAATVATTARILKTA
jgi:hypothetical protein